MGFSGRAAYRGQVGHWLGDKTYYMITHREFMQKTRRTFLGATGVSALMGLAGCIGISGNAGNPTSTGTSESWTQQASIPRDAPDEAPLMAENPTNETHAFPTYSDFIVPFSRKYL